MKAKITKASDWKYGDIKEFNTLEDLLKFQEECDEELIIARLKKSSEGDIQYEIMIYDGYIE